ncbi:hypothetical protein FLA105534_03958 [Flavobacterium bizetiae]|uniref:Lipoprotein n=1 Tax=Flavobacterium bizetiae TaxID=2704140 RepID=A0A6J4GVE7_9FLAO|nr:hypothetical protein [Flavobacterium bizetiae]CAA9202174.1 hypothetical protein FLA105534_03958 [Flavobacterium bizetiae]CAD5343928.1 hypothetical protein FLA105535_03930 [Flavobacterium bizetiae]CAD5349918.1 hypothetical protein FLA105534_03905 [Flavobacterium bizetiae]
MKIKAIILVLICSATVFVSCKKEEKATKFKDKSETKQDIRLDSLALLYKTTNKENTEEIRITAYEPSENDKHFLVGDKNFILVSKYLKEGNEFKLIKKDTLISNEYNYTEIGKESFQKTTIKNQEYILLSIRESYQGTAVTEQTVSFIMLNTQTLKSYTLMYAGEISLRSKQSIDGEFIDSKILDSEPEIKKVLYEFANKSKLIFHISKDENHYTNYVQKWETDNNSINHLANGYSGIPDTIYSTYYKDDLFNFTGDYNKSESIENNNFKIVSFFRGNIIAFDKNKKLYFPIYTETCVTGCDKKIKFVSENSIEVLYHESSENETSIINLDEIIFKN